MVFSFDQVFEGFGHRVKDQEKARIFEAIRANPGTTRKQLASQLEIRPTSVSMAVGELLTGKLVIESSSRPGTRGRPEIGLSGNANRFAVATFYVIGRSLVMALVNLAENTLFENSLNLPPRSGPSQFECAIRRLLEEAKSRLPHATELLGAAFSLVGTVDSAAKKWVCTARWPRLRNIDFKGLERDLGMTVSVRRALDTELAFLLASGPKLRTGGTVLFHWGFGIGSAYAWNGRILDSSVGRFGEIGHTRIDITSRRKCLCGGFGCLETEASLWALLPALRKENPATPQDEGKLAAFLQTNGFRAPSALERGTRYVGEGILNLYKILYPDRILAVGPFFESPSLFKSVNRCFRSGLPGYARKQVRFTPIQGGFKGCLLGSALPFFEERLRHDLIAKS